MSDRRRVYLDNAATSFPKPPGVAEAMLHFATQIGASAGRASSRAGQQAQAIVDRCRHNCARLLGVSDPERVVFTFNGTDSLNLAIRGLLRPGDHVVSSHMEHNSVLRPLSSLQATDRVSTTYVTAEPGGQISAESIAEALRPDTRAVVVQHASNVTGTVHDIEAIGRVARERDVPLIVDAAQSIGHLPFDFDALPADIACCPGHKALLGPLGTGIMLLSRGIAGRLRPIRTGGTGSQSELREQPQTLPDRYESGNHNVIGLAGLEKSTAYLLERGIETIREHELSLTDRLVSGLQAQPGVTVHRPHGDGGVGVVSFSLAAYDAHTAGMLLDEQFHIETRCGLHCSPGVHEFLGTRESGGTIRASLGPFTTADEIDLLLEATAALATL